MAKNPMFLILIIRFHKKITLSNFQENSIRHVPLHKIYVTKESRAPHKYIVGVVIVERKKSMKQFRKVYGTVRATNELRTADDFSNGTKALRNRFTQIYDIYDNLVQVFKVSLTFTYLCEAL